MSFSKIYIYIYYTIMDKLLLLSIFSLSFAALVSTYIFIQAFILRKNEYFYLFNYWQVPMIMALLVEAIHRGL
jgi:hypothetical protein